MTTYTATRAAANFPVYQPEGSGDRSTAWGAIQLSTLLAATDVIKLCRLPRGAVVLGGRIKGSKLASGATAASQSMVLNIGVDASRPGLEPMSRSYRLRPHWRRASSRTALP